MNKLGKWQLIRELGAGGQGKVHLVRDTSQFDENTVLMDMIHNFRHLTTMRSDEKARVIANDLTNDLKKLMDADNPSYQGALKLLYEPEKNRDFEKAQERIKKEIRALSEITHTNILKILDYPPEMEWFVAEYHQHGTLSRSPNLYRGDVLLSPPANSAYATVHGSTSSP